MSASVVTCPVCHGTTDCPECKAGRADCSTCEGLGICVYCDGLGLVPWDHAEQIGEVFALQMRGEVPPILRV